MLIIKRNRKGGKEREKRGWKNKGMSKRKGNCRELQVSGSLDISYYKIAKGQLCECRNAFTHSPKDQMSV